MSMRPGNPGSVGDVYVRSSDGVIFVSSSKTLQRVSPVFRARLADASTELGPQSKSNPTLTLDEGTVVVKAILQAVDPLPSPPITSLPLALECFRAAKKYGLSYTLFRLDESAFRDRRDEPFRYAAFAVCAMAWRTGQWGLVEHAARFTHAVQPDLLFQQANQIPGAHEALAALMATRFERAYRIAAVVHLLPLNKLTCSACQAAYPNSVSVFITSVESIFLPPYPEPLAIFDQQNPRSLAHPAVLVRCERRTCKATVEDYKFSSDEIKEITAAFERVPQTVRKSVLDLKVKAWRSSLENAWEGM